MSMQLSSRTIKRHLILAAAGLGALAFVPRAGAGLQGANPAPDPNANSAPNQTVQNQVATVPHLPDGFAEKEEDAASGVKSTLVGLTNRAVTKDSYDSFFSGFLSELAKRDKDRAQEFKGVNQGELNGIIAQIQSEWRAKYNQDFDVSDKNLVFNEQFPMAQGEVSDTAVASMNWPMTPAPGLAVQAGANSDQQRSNTKVLTQGKAVAVICFPPGDNLPAIKVSLIHQAMTGWYVDVPTDRTGEQIYNDLVTHLNYIASHQDRWPSDVTDAYRMVARQVVAALYGVSPNNGTASAR
jgi:hypothetical protein